MKKIGLILMFAVMATAAMAQDAACSIGLQIGFSQKIARTNVPTNEKAQQETLNKLSLNGAKVGLVVEGNIIKGFGTFISLNYSYNGGATAWKQRGELIYPKDRYRNNLHSLELVCDWQYKFKIAQSTYFILYTGPGIQCNLSFHEQKFTQYTQGGPIDDSDIKDQLIRSAEKADDYKAYNRLNVTWGVGAGFQYDRYFIRGGYDFGLINPYSYSNFDQIISAQTKKAMYASQATRGRQDQWFIKLGIYLWQSDN